MAAAQPHQTPSDAEAFEPISRQVGRLSLLLGVRLHALRARDGKAVAIQIHHPDGAAVVALSGLTPEATPVEVARWLSVLADGIEQRRVTHGPIAPPAGTTVRRLGPVR